MCKVDKIKYHNCGHWYKSCLCCMRNAPRGPNTNTPFFPPEKCSFYFPKSTIKLKRPGFCPDCKVKPVHKRMERESFSWLKRLWRKTPASYEYDVRYERRTLMAEECFEPRSLYRVEEEPILPTWERAGHTSIDCKNGR
jgi:hypothetical protein